MSTMASRRAKLMTSGPAKRKDQKAKTKAKPTMKTKTCPTCAETFKASRSSKVYCSDNCRWYHAHGIPQAMAQKAEAIRQQRTEAAAQRREKAGLQREREERNNLRRLIRITDCDHSCVEYEEEGGSPMVEEKQRLRAESRYC